MGKITQLFTGKITINVHGIMGKFTIFAGKIPTAWWYTYPSETYESQLG
jgi:hypothetical protein